MKGKPVPAIIVHAFSACVYNVYVAGSMQTEWTFFA